MTNSRIVQGTRAGVLKFGGRITDRCSQFETSVRYDGPEDQGKESSDGHDGTVRQVRNILTGLHMFLLGKHPYIPDFSDGSGFLKNRLVPGIT